MRLILLPLLPFLLLLGCAQPSPTDAPEKAKIEPPVAPAPENAGELLAYLNTSFDGESGAFIKDWFISQQGGATSFESVADTEVFRTPPSAARISRYGESAFSMLSQALNVVPEWRGRTVNLSAFIKTQGVDSEGRGGAALVIRTDKVGWNRADGGVVGHNLMEVHRLKGDNDWQHVAIELKVPAAATLLRVGVMLQGGGTMWVDDLRAVLLPAESSPPAAR